MHLDTCCRGSEFRMLPCETFTSNLGLLWVGKGDAGHEGVGTIFKHRYTHDG